MAAHLTLRGFLRGYLKHLSGMGTLDIRRLAAAMLDGRSRLAEPLYLHAALCGQTGRLMGAVAGGWAADEYAGLVERYRTEDELLAALAGDAEEMPVRYRKLYKSYAFFRDRAKNDRAFCLNMRDAISRMLAEQGLSRYRVCRDLGLNAGNVNTYLKNGDARAVSRQTVSRLFAYLRDRQLQGQ